MDGGRARHRLLDLALNALIGALESARATLPRIAAIGARAAIADHGDDERDHREHEQQDQRVPVIVVHPWGLALGRVTCMGIAAGAGYAAPMTPEAQAAIRLTQYARGGG